MVEMNSALGMEATFRPAFVFGALNPPTDTVGPTAPAAEIEALLAANRPTEIELSIEREIDALWCKLKPSGRPSFTRMLLADLGRMQAAIATAFTNGAQRPFEYFITSSLTPGYFNLGGDLHLFREKINARDEAALRAYAHRCVEIIYMQHRGYEHRVTTIALVQGDALGGGFEAALASDMIVAEHPAKMGFPEILFNLFPGMGAYTFLCRRIGVTKTEEMLRTGNTYSAAQLYELGVVDLVVEEGQGERAVRELIQKSKSRQNALSALYQVRRRVNPVTLEELKDIADIWVAAALRLAEQDLRRMSRIINAQDRAQRRRVPELATAN
jgi:DSF synthase